MTAEITEIRRRRTYRGEDAWFELLDRFGFRALRAGFVACGVTPQVAGGIVWFLDDQRMLDRSQTDSTRNRYRQILATLSPSEVAKAAAEAFPG